MRTLSQYIKRTKVPVDRDRAYASILRSLRWHVDNGGLPDPQSPEALRSYLLAMGGNEGAAHTKRLWRALRKARQQKAHRSAKRTIAKVQESVG